MEKLLKGWKKGPLLCYNNRKTVIILKRPAYGDGQL